MYERTFNDVVHNLGTSGMLYQSNKLMYDAATNSLWSTLRGQPVVGSLADQGITLRRQPVVNTTWKQWKQRHPDTTVLSLNTGHRRDYSDGAAYAAYFSNDRLMFPVPRHDDRLKNKDEVLALRSDSGDQTLAISEAFLRQNPVYHDRLGEQELVVLTDPSGANRVYESSGVTFTEWDNGATVTDTSGQSWRVDETGLHGPAQQVLARIPAHRSFWFGWYAAFPETRLVQ